MTQMTDGNSRRRA